MLYRNLFSALYVAQDRAWLLAGSQFWDVARIRTVTQKRDGLWTASYELLFQGGERSSIRLEMPVAVTVQRLVDPTYDEIDSWSDDIMKCLPYVAADSWRSSAEDVSTWAREVLPTWLEGFEHSS